MNLYKPIIVGGANISLMATLDFGTRLVRRMNYNRVVSLPKAWLRHRGLEDAGAVRCVMNEAGDLVLSPAEET